MVSVITLGAQSLTSGSHVSSLLAPFCAPDGDQDRADYLHTVFNTEHPDIQVLPLNTRDPHHHPPAPLYLPPLGRPYLPD